MKRFADKEMRMNNKGGSKWIKIEFKKIAPQDYPKIYYQFYVVSETPLKKSN